VLSEDIELVCNARELGLTFSEGSLGAPYSGLISTLEADSDLILNDLDSKQRISQALLDEVIVLQASKNENVDRLNGYAMLPLPIDRPYDGSRRAEVDPWNRFFIKDSSAIRILGRVELLKTKEVINFDLVDNFRRLKFVSIIT